MERIWISAITGRKGRGKTCLMTYFGYTDYVSGRKVYANYHTTFADYITLKEVAALPDHLRGCTVLLDEVQKGADAREVFKPGNKGINDLATQLRKLDIMLYYTTQKWEYPDKRLREQAEQHIHCETTPEEGIFNLTLYDRTIPSFRDMVLEAEEFTFDGRPYFDMYDTDEIISFEGSRTAKHKKDLKTP